jgi:hypothetical protein
VIRLSMERVYCEMSWLQKSKRIEITNFEIKFDVLNAEVSTTVNREIFASVLSSRENFNANALTIKFLQQTWNFVYR